MQDLSIANADGFAVAETAGSSTIIGKMLKFNDSRYIPDKTETLPEGTTRVAGSVITAWVHWEDKRPIDHRVTHVGQSHPLRDELPDQDKTEWPLGLNGEPSDRWRDTRYLHLIDPNTGADYTFVTESYGGRKAIGALKQQIANVRTAHPGALPLVQLASAPMKTRFGPKPRPDFKVVGWRGGKGDGGTGNATLAPANDTDDDIPF